MIVIRLRASCHDTQTHAEYETDTLCLCCSRSVQSVAMIVNRKAHACQPRAGGGSNCGRYNDTRAAFLRARV